MKVRLLHHTPSPKEFIGNIASICYDSIPSEKIVDHCFDSGHESVLEHVTFTFKIEGVSRALTHQLVRHRIASPTQRSQRYVVEDCFDYVVPPTLRTNTEIECEYHALLQHIQEFYNKAVQHGIPAEDARYILPNATVSTIVITMNLRSLINFMHLRLCQHSQWEIRELAREMAFYVGSVAPELTRFLEPECIHLGYCRQRKSCGLMPLKKKVLEGKKGEA